MYDTLTVPTIMLSSYDFASSALNQKIIDSITFSEAMNKYGIVAMHVNNIESQKNFDQSYSNILNYFVNTSMKYKQQFYTKGFPSLGWIPFKSESQTYKYNIIENSPFYNDTTLKDDSIDMFNLNQTYEPMESFFFASNQNKSLNSNVFLPNANNIPKEFRSNAQDLWNEYQNISKYIFDIAMYSLGESKSTNNVVDSLQRNEYFNGLKLAYYYGFDDRTKEVYNACINDYLYRYGIHYDIGMFTILKLDDTKGFQVRYDYKWYTIDMNDYPPNTFFVMSGNLMNILTNGYWKPTVHRVLSVLPTKLSIVLFSQVALNTIMNQFTNCYSCNQQKNNNETTMYFKKIAGKSEQEIMSEFFDPNRMKETVV